MPQPHVHVLVINWNGKEHLEECFASLVRTSYDNARFVLLDNGSSDGSEEFVRARFGSDPRVDVIRIEENCGWSGANNIGIEAALEAGADYVLLLNNDTAIDAECIPRLVEHAEGKPKVGALAPKLLLYDTPELINSIGLEASWIGAAWDRGLGRIDDERWDAVVPVPGVCGAGYFLRSEAVRAAGLLAADFEIYLDDYDHGLRVWDAGFTIETCPAARIRHKFSATMNVGARANHKHYLNTRNRFRVMERNFPRGKWPESLLATLPAELRAVGRATLDMNFGKVWAQKKAWLAAVAYLPKAAAFRREEKRRGRHFGEYWSLLRSDLSFFPGVELPEHGWYRSRLIDGKRVRPIAKFAHYLHEAGKLRITQMNPFPENGPLDIEMIHNGEVVAHLTTNSVEELEFDLSRGDIIFKASTIFRAEDIGETFDTGGWIGIEPY